MLPRIKSADGVITVLVNNCEPYSFSKSHINYPDLLKCVDAGDGVNFVRLFDIEKTISNSLDVYIVDKDVDLHISNGQIFYNGEVVNNFICDRIMTAYKTNVSYKNLINFLKKLLSNPSKNSVDGLYSFLEHKGMPITDDGDFIAWKSVKPDFMDKYSGTIDNSVGKVIEIPRNKVDDNSANHCSHGLHVGALEYSGPGGWYNSQGDKVLAVKVNPRDAVSVPSDHGFTKLRVCRYEVIGEFKNAPTSVFTNKKDSLDFIDRLDAEEWEDEEELKDAEDSQEERDWDAMYEQDGYLDDHEDDDDEDDFEDDDDDDYDDDEEENDDNDDDDSGIMYDFQGYFPGEVIQFSYQKPGHPAACRKLRIESLIRSNGNTTHIYGVDEDDGNVKSFRTDRIDFATVKGI